MHFPFIGLSAAIILTWAVLSIPDAARETPLQATNYERLTGYAELQRYVKDVAADSPHIEYHTLGRSVEGREIPYLTVSAGDFGVDPEKLTILIFAQQHGNEPSGKEAALLLLHRVAAGSYTDWLRQMDILLVPQVNPDGSEVHQRHNLENVDLNRSHVLLNAPETIALRRLFHEHLPEVTLDVHEYYPWSRDWTQHGYIRLFDQQFGTSTNINTDSAIRQLGDELFIPHAEAYLEQTGFSFHNYLVGSPDYIRYSTSNINDGRQSFGLLGTFSLILEGKRSKYPYEDLNRRAHGQLAAIEALLAFSADNRARTKETVETARASLREGRKDTFALTMDRVRSARPLMIPVQRIDEHTDSYVASDTLLVALERYHPETQARLSTLIPDYYLIPAGQSRLLKLMDLHQVQSTVLKGGESFRAERYRLGDFRMHELANARYSLPDVQKEDVEYHAAAGDVLVSTRQLHRHFLATTLEPQSKHGLLQYDEFADWRAMTHFPVLRVNTYPDERAAAPYWQGSAP